MTHHRPVTVALREVDRNPGHVRVQVFAGRTPGTDGNAGTLTFRTGDWDELRELIVQHAETTGTPRAYAAHMFALRFEVLPARHDPSPIADHLETDDA